MKSKRRRGLSGTVLIMVLTVMFVLIIMLMAALTVVTTANQRIYTKFEENQAYYTARSALDVFTEKMLDDSDYYAQNGTGDVIYTHGDNVTTDKMDQGLALQLDLYKITAQSGDNIAQSSLTTYANSISVAADKKDEYKTWYGTDSTAVLADASGNEYIEYRITGFPQVGSGKTNDYATMLDEGTASGTYEATIKVEVLDRTYDVDMSKVNDGTYADKATLLASADGAEAVLKGNRKRDSMRIKITSTVQFMDVEGTAVLIYDTSTPPVNNSSRAVTAFGGGGSDNMNIIDGSAMGNNVTWNNQGVIYGNTYAEQNFTMNTGAKVHLDENESFFVGGDMDIQNSNFQLFGKNTITDKNKRPFLYVNGALKLSNGDTSTFNDVDIIAAGGVTTNGSNKFYTGNGNVYIQGDLDVSAVQNMGGSGNIYVDGNIKINSDSGRTFYKDTSGVSPKIVLKGGLTGNIYVSGGFADASTGAIISAPIQNSGFTGTCTVGSATAHFTLPTLADIKNPIGGSNTIQVTFPGTVKKEVATHVSCFDQYYKKDADGHLLDASGAVITSPSQTPVPIDAETQAGVTGFTMTDLGITDNITTVPTVSDPTYGMVKKIDTTTGMATAYNIPQGTKTNTIYVTGGGTVQLLLNAGGGRCLDETDIVVSDNTTLKIYGNGGGNYTFFKCSVFTDTTYAAAKTGATLQVGSKEGYGIKVPNIYYYFSSGSNVYMDNGGFLTGYFYGPGATLNTSSSPMYNLTMSRHGTTVQNHSGGTSVGMTLVGSALCNNISFPNQNGIAYINPALAGSGTPGKPIHSFDAYQYTRS